MLEFLFESVKLILKDDLKICQTAAKFIFHLLSEEQKENHISM